MQVLLKLEQLDPRIKLELATDAPMGALEPDVDLDLVDSLLQTNQTLELLKDLCKKALVTTVDKDTNCKWKLEDRLLTYLSRLVVADKPNLQTRLIAEAHRQVSTAYLRKNKTCKLITACYYWPRITPDIDCYIRNYNNC
jgi:hypothetical protein